MQGKDTLIDYLKQLGLSYHEANLYVTLLESGPVNVREIAKLVDIKRTTTYFYIEQLLEKGLITRITKGSQKLFCANQPNENIQRLAAKKIETANKIQSALPDILTVVNNSLQQRNETNETTIKYYKGKNGVINIFEDFLQAKEIRSFANVTEFADVFPENFQIIDNAIKKSRDMKFFEILENSPQAKLTVKDAFGNKNKNYQYKYFPEGMKISSTDITIYDGKVSFINMKDDISGVIMQSSILYNDFKILFDFIWEQLSN